MIRYEVTLQIQNSSFEKMLEWLRTEHIPDMLGETGFLRAELLLESKDFLGSTDRRKVRVIYFCESAATLKNYLAERAPVLRQKGLALFPNQFTAERGIWVTPSSGSAEF